MLQKRRWKTLALMRRMLTCAICVIGLLALFSVHLNVFPSSTPTFPDSYKLPTQREAGFQKLSTEVHLSEELAPPHHLSKSQHPYHKLLGDGEILDYSKLWKPPPNRGFAPCLERSPSYTYPRESQGYLLVHTNGGLNQMRAGIGGNVLYYENGQCLKKVAYN